MKPAVTAATLAICLIFLIFRFWLAVNAKHGDMYNNLDWGAIAVDHGLSGFYDLPKAVWPHSAPNQPAGSIYLHTASVVMDRSVDKIIKRLNDQIPAFPSKLVWWWEWNGSLVTIKYFSILADFIIAAAILVLARHIQRPRTGLLVALAYLVNPALWYNSSFWGQTDSVVAALSLTSLVLLAGRRLAWSPVFLGLSLSVKASWAPILPFYILYYWLNHRSRLLTLLLIPAVVVLAFAPFHPHPDLPGWLSSLYLHRILPGETAFITVLAFNFWNLLFGPYGVPHTIPLFGIPANILGWAAVALLAAPLTIRLVKTPRFTDFVWASALLFFAVFLFAPKMIHRYLYPVFPLLHLALLFDRRRFWLAAALAVMSGLYLINLYYRWWAPGSILLESLYTDRLMKLISVAYLAVFILLYKHSVHAKV